MGGAIDELLESGSAPATKACCACGGGTYAMVQVNGDTLLSLKITVTAMLVFICALSAAVLYYRRSYNKIAYASIETAATLGKRDSPVDLDETPADLEGAI